MRKPGIQRRVSRLLKVCPSFVSKVAAGKYAPKTPKGIASVQRVRDALRRESRGAA